MWRQEYIDYGLAEPKGTYVRVYKDQFSYINMPIGESVSYVVWAGKELNVFLENGKTRRYKDQFSYRTIQ
jgi:hypothetical protein